jgi:hypothetical protein
LFSSPRTSAGNWRLAQQTVKELTDCGKPRWFVPLPHELDKRVDELLAVRG